MKLLSALLCNFCALSASTLLYPETPVKEEQRECNNRPVRPMRVSARYTTPDGIGYKPGYTTVEGFFSKKTQNDWVPFLDLRGHVFDDGKLAANAGLGLRHLWGKRVWGVNGYYDYRNTSHQHYNQVAAGLEWLGRVWDFRLNGYLPVGDKESHLFGSRFKEFSGHHMLLKTKRDFAFKGANFEIGVHVDTFKKAPLYFNFGPYYLTGKGATTWGGEARGAVDLFNRYLRIEGNVSYDHFFKWVGQGQFSVNIPFGKRQRINRNFSCCMELAMLDRLVQRVDRNEIVPVGREHLTQTAINPATGLPYYFVFVDNTSSSDGTFESPYPTLVQAQDASSVNDIIYIFPGNQTTTGMDAGITLKDGQKLWGSVVAHALPTQLGSIQIPAQSIGPFVDNVFGTSIAMLPIITNSASPVVTVANNNEIDGLYVQVPVGGFAISDNALTVSNLTVRHCTLQGGTDAFNLSDIVGMLVIEKNSITSDSGSTITSTTSNVSVSFANNQIVSTSTGINLTFNEQASLQFNDNILNAGTSGLVVDQNNSSTLVNATVSDNKIFTGSIGVNLSVRNEMQIKLRSNEITSSGGGLPSILIDQGSGSLAGIIEDNTINASNIGARINGFGDATAVTFRSNTIVASEQGILINANGDETALSFGSNAITSYANRGIDLQHTRGSLAATVEGNNILSEQDVGFNYQNSGSAISAALTVNNNNIDALRPISVNQSAGSLTASVLKNTLTPTDFSNALSFQFNSPATSQNATLKGNTVTQGLGNGFSFGFGSTGGSANWTIDNNTFYGLASRATNINSTGGTTTVCLTFNDNTAYPIQQPSGAGTYVFDNSGNAGTFKLNPPTGNIGNFDTTGVIVGPCP